MKPSTLIDAQATTALMNSIVGLPSSLLFSTTPLVIAPKTPIGEKLPAVAPWTTTRPIRTRLIRYRAAKPIAIGATIATAAGVTAPMLVTSAQTTNITHGTSATRPRTSPTDACTIQSTVPLFFARANR